MNTDFRTRLFFATRDGALNLAVAMGLSAGIYLLRAWLHVVPDRPMAIDLVVVAAILLADPAAARRKGGWPAFGRRLAVGGAIGVGLSAGVAIALEDGGGMSNPILSRRLVPDMIWVAFGVLAALAVILRVLPPPQRRKREAASVPLSNAQPKGPMANGLSLPWITLSAQALVLVALLVIGAGLPLGLMVYVAGLALAAAQTWTVPPVEIPVEMAETSALPTPDKTPEPISRHRLRACLASALFLGGLGYSSVALAAPWFTGIATTTEPARLIADLAIMAGVLLVGSLTFVVLGALLASISAYLVGRRHGLGPLALQGLGKQALTRLFVGDTHWHAARSDRA